MAVPGQSRREAQILRGAAREAGGSGVWVRFGVGLLLASMVSMREETKVGTSEKIKAALAKFGNGVLTEAQFVAIMTRSSGACKPIKHAAVVAEFKRLDANGDGLVDHDDVAASWAAAIDKASMDMYATERLMRSSMEKAAAEKAAAEKAVAEKAAAEKAAATEAAAALAAAEEEEEEAEKAAAETAAEVAAALEAAARSSSLASESSHGASQ